MPQAPNGIWAQRAATWVPLLAVAIGGISWMVRLDGRVESLEVEVEQRRGAMSLIEGNQKEIVRLERAQDRILTELDRRADEREDYKEAIARMGEHLRTLDERLVQAERVVRYQWDEEGEPGVR